MARKASAVLSQLFLGDSHDYLDKIADDSVDLVVCDGPYGATDHAWDGVRDIQTYNLALIKVFARILKPGGALYLFGKPDGMDCIDYRPYLRLVSKIVWYQPSRLAQGRRTYTNNYDLIAYFTKGKAKTYNLDAVRVPQLVELTHRLRCERVPSVQKGPFGKTLFNPKGKNPGDVWGDIKQLTYKSKELLQRNGLHSIQKPLALIERIIKASSNEGDLVLDPFVGTGTTLVACEKLKRKWMGCEMDPKLVAIAHKRLAQVSAYHSKTTSLAAA